MMDTNQQPKPPGSAGTQGVSSLKKTAADATTTAKEHIEHAGDELRAQASRGVDAAKETIVEQSTMAKDTTAGELSRTARALHDAASKLDGDDHGRSHVPQSLLREAADGLDELAQSLQGRSVGEMVGDLSAFGRKNPVAFMGAAALAGFALGRFARASERHAAPADYPAPQSQPTPGATRQPPVATASGAATKPFPAATGGTTHG